MLEVFRYIEEPNVPWTYRTAIESPARHAPMPAIFLAFGLLGLAVGKYTLSDYPA
jgi:hypothetical protein